MPSFGTESIEHVAPSIDHPRGGLSDRIAVARTFESFHYCSPDHFLTGDGLRSGQGREGMLKRCVSTHGECHPPDDTRSVSQIDSAGFPSVDVRGAEPVGRSLEQANRVINL